MSMEQASEWIRDGLQVEEAEPVGEGRHGIPLVQLFPCVEEELDLWITGYAMGNDGRRTPGGGWVGR